MTTPSRAKHCTDEMWSLNMKNCVWKNTLEMCCLTLCKSFSINHWSMALQSMSEDIMCHCIIYKSTLRIKWKNTLAHKLLLIYRCCYSCSYNVIDRYPLWQIDAFHIDSCVWVQFVNCAGEAEHWTVSIHDSLRPKILWIRQAQSLDLSVWCKMV